MTSSSVISECESSESDGEQSDDTASEGEAGTLLHSSAQDPTQPGSPQRHLQTGTNDSSQELSEKLYPGCRISRAESLLLIMGHSLRHHSTKEATESLLKVIEAHLPKDTNFPVSKYLFFKEFCGSSCATCLHMYCPSCHSYIGEINHVTPDCYCTNCETSHSTDTLVKTGSYFVMLDIKQQLQHLLQRPDLNFKFTDRRMSLDVKDITESKAYHTLPLEDGDLSLTWNTDGVPVFVSSKFSIWPLQLMVNELPQRQRFDNIILGGLWFSSSKPEMNCFLRPFVKEMNMLSSDGMTWVDASGREHTCRVFPGACCVDTVARCAVTNTTQFNGAFGCVWCEHEGIVVEKGRGSARVYPHQAAPAKCRTDKTFRKYAQRAQVSGEPCRGVKGPSVL
ncbi:uncharacterized protein LOC135392373 [Ornithodoros turicata]|uniref:uncharacterized protein LOC135392373 n=1 Tax=Ornithodoros turicata TaxID=34597 RepID=UPI003138F90C